MLPSAGSSGNVETAFAAVGEGEPATGRVPYADPLRNVDELGVGAD